MQTVSEIVREIENSKGRKLDLNKDRDRKSLFMVINRKTLQQSKVINKIKDLVNHG